MHPYVARHKREYRRFILGFQSAQPLEPLEPRSYLSGVSFAAPVPVDSVLGANEHEVITADFNGDHLPDLAVLRQNAVDILISQGNGNFTLKQTLTTGRQASYMQAADLGNGHVDLIVSNVVDGTLDVFNGNGNGTFSLTPQIMTFGSAQPVGFSGTLADIDAFTVTHLNGSGKPDIIVADGVDNKLVTFINQGAGTFSTGQKISTVAANSPIVALANASGVASGVIILDQNAPIAFLFANQNGTLATSPSQLSLGAPAQTFKAAGSLVVGDFNGDGIPDIAATINAISGATSYVSVLLGSANGTFQLAQRNAVPANSNGLAVGDFNGDGTQDLLLGTNNNANIDILLGNGDGTFTDQNLSLVKGIGDGREIAVADFNGDGKVDFVVAPASSAAYLFAGTAPRLSATTTALVASMNPANTGQAVTFTATVSSSGGTPTGSVQFFDLSTLLASETLAGGVATFSNVTLTDGMHGITAQYVGTAQFAASTSNLILETIGPGLGTGIGLSPAITRSTVPPALASGAPVRGTVTLKVTNTNVATDVGANVIVVYATTDGVVDDGSIPLAQVKVRLNLKANRSQTIVAPIHASAIADGTYTIVAQATDASGNVVTSTTGPILTVAAPFLALSETVTPRNLSPSVVSGSASHALARVLITNMGNIALKGTTTIALSASTTADVPGIAINSLSRFLSIRANGGTATVLVPFKALPQVPDDSYYIVANVTDPMGGTSTGSSAGTTRIAAPFINLSLTFGNLPRFVLTTGASLSISNAGNINDAGPFSAVIGFSTDSGGSDIAGTDPGILAAARLTVRAGTTARVHVTGWETLFNELATSLHYFLTVTVTDANGNSASAVSGTEF